MDNADMKEMVLTTIKTQIIAAFNDSPEVVEKLVDAALRKEVNEYGHKPNGYRDERMPYLDYLVGEQIRNACHDIIKEYVNDYKPALRVQIETAIKEANFSSTLTDLLSGAIINDWQWQFELNAKRKDEG